MSAGTVGSDQATTAPLSQRAGRIVSRAGILIPFLIAFAVLTVISPPFLRFGNLTNILDQQAGIIIVACAGTFVLIAGGIDLSIGAIYGLAGAVALTTASSVSPVAGVLTGLAVGLAVGIANGVIVTQFRINPLIGTLAMTFVVSGIAAIVTKGNLVVALDHLDFQSFAATKFVGISSAAWIMIVIAILAAILLSRTTFGRYVYATGGNPKAARLGGVRINAVRVATFALSGTAAALAGTLDASRVLSAQASSGQFLTFTVLTGIIVGGTSILGGEGTIGRTVLGCLFVALIANGFNLLGIDPFYQQVTLGVILLLAVGVDAWSRRFE
jgi:ribose transport system permease protein